MTEHSELVIRGEGLSGMSTESLEALTRQLGRQGIDVVASDGRIDQDDVTRDFFGRSPEEVAEGLIDKTLVVGNKRGVITAVLPQLSADNGNWLDRPLFGSYPVDAYVTPPYRGYNLLFLRTGLVDTCVRIDGLDTARKSYPRPGLVTKALGITRERTGNVAFDGEDTVSIDWIS
ncbi:MAG TPA: hypothetical protein VMR76_00085 [Candidatus Saccharimonadia bacterium]|nr:hypothetical protein [Candidatus Saccharimonadia bacterium]